MKASILALCLLLTGTQTSFAQTPTSNTATTPPTKAQQEIIDLSKQKWQWMADKNVEKLAQLFDDKSKFVHMSGTWKKDEELDIIKTGSIWYKQADVHDVAVELFDNSTAIIWSRITLVAMVRGTEAKTEFTVTEVYKKQGRTWKVLALTFSSVRDTHVIKH
ncbi:MAG: nuclear transport factor 2 family protein [Cytophagaceae bacterium]|nr:MAG: nuclear transport factor 2 family protein [Cytophagaceae bacterium]